VGQRDFCSIGCELFFKFYLVFLTTLKLFMQSILVTPGIAAMTELILVTPVMELQTGDICNGATRGLGTQVTPVMESQGVGGLW
jgi:hypothetical protein